MGTYLVQSGTLRTTVRADDARKAALWAVHQSLQQVLPPEDGTRRTPAPRPSALGPRIRVLSSDAVEAACLDTYDVVLEWNQLMVALARLEREELAAAG